MRKISLRSVVSGLIAAVMLAGVLPTTIFAASGVVVADKVMTEAVDTTNPEGNEVIPVIVKDDSGGGGNITLDDSSGGGGSGGGGGSQIVVVPWADKEFDVITEVFEWGTAVTAVIIDLGEDMTQAEAEAVGFAVRAKTVMPTDESVIYDGARTITDTYVSATNAVGSPVRGEDTGRYIVLELKNGYNATAAEIDGSAAVNYSGRNYLLDLTYTVTVGDSALTQRDVLNKTLDEDFALVQNNTAGFTNEHYRMYTPAGAAGKKLPVVVFNHGSGETYAEAGGGNEGSQLYANMGGAGWVQNAPEDAYVIVPQRGTGVGAPGYSRAGLIAFIQKMIADGKADANRIYVSGASAGGRETHDYLMEYPEFFAAAIPICPAGGQNLTAQQVESFKDVPVWYIHGATDGSVILDASKVPFDLLTAAGAQDARRTVFPAVATANGDRSVFGTELPNDGYLGTDGKPLAFYPDGHWSWVMVLNNVKVDGIGLMNWLFAQRKADENSLQFDVVTEVFEWGTAVTAVIIDLGEGETATQAEVDAKQFAVQAKTVMPKNGSTIYNGARTITDTYVSATNEKGKEADSGRYIVLELKNGYNATAAEIDGSAAVNYSGQNFFLRMNYYVLLGGNQLIQNEVLCKTLDEDFALVQNDAAGFTNEHYRMHTPAGAAGKKLPVVVFNHGAGETYNETNGGNEGSQLYANMGGAGWVQNAPEDAYVIVPQRGTGTGAPGYSRPGLIAFIQKMITDGKVDANRIYVSGASAGGRETHDYLMAYPEFFAAAMPICPAGGQNLTAADVAKFKNVPVWYIHGGTDGTVILDASKVPFDLLTAAGAKDVRRTVFPAVATANGARSVFGTELPNDDYLGTDGNPLAFYPDGHWSWVMVLNNVEVEDTRLMNWLFAQERTAEEKPVALESISLDKTAVALTVGGTSQLTVAFTPAGATNKAVTFATSNNAVAIVDATGKVTAVAVGTAVITATAQEGGFTASATVTVTAAETPTEPGNSGSTGGRRVIQSETIESTTGTAATLPSSVTVTATGNNKVAASAIALPTALATGLNAKDAANSALAKASAVSVTEPESAIFQPAKVTFDTKGITLQEGMSLTAVRFDAGGNLTTVASTLADGKVSYTADKPGNYAVLFLGNNRVGMTSGSMNYTVNGAARKMDAVPAVLNGRTMVPVRFVIESLGGQVGWDAATGTVSITIDGKTINLVIGQLSPGMESAPYIGGDDRTMIPLRYVTEMLGCFVSYNADTNAIDIFK